MPVTVKRISESGFIRLKNGTLLARDFDEIVIPGGLDIPFVPTGAGDITSFWNSQTGYADYQLVGTQLAAGANLETSLIISLFSDRMAAADDEIPDGTANRRGWWADPTMGSRLWLLERSKLTKDLPLRCSDYIYEATQWYIDDGVVASVSVETAIILPSMLGAQVFLYRRDGTRVGQNFAWVWR